MEGNPVSPASPIPLISAISAPAPTTLESACGRNPGIACRLIWDISHDVTTARLVATYLADPLKAAFRIAFVVALAIFARWLAHRFIDRLTGKGRGSLVPRRLRAKAAAVLEAAPVAFSERRRQRAHALGSILNSIASVVIFGIAALTILGDLGLNLAPLLASAGVAGVAIGFGAQNLVKDFLSGIFMLLEDQYGVGDDIDVGASNGTVEGTVEGLGLRSTRLRALDGTLWHVPNGEIRRVGNHSQGWARAVLDLAVANDTDADTAIEVIHREAAALWKDEQTWGSLILQEPEVWGIEDLGPSGYTVRLVVKTRPREQWRVARELRARIKDAFDKAGIEIPGP